jgi:hypothetical protein
VEANGSAAAPLSLSVTMTKVLHRAPGAARDHREEVLRFLVVGGCGYVLALLLCAGIAAATSLYPTKNLGARPA